MIFSIEKYSPLFTFIFRNKLLSSLIFILFNVFNKIKFLNGLAQLEAEKIYLEAIKFILLFLN
jgi:hypothetical protein